MHARRRTHSPKTLGHANKELHARSYIIMNFSLYLHSNQSLTQAESPPFSLSLSLSAEEVLRSPKKSCVTKLFQKPNTKPAISSSQQIEPQPQYTCWRRKRYSIRFGFVLCYITGSFDTPKKFDTENLAYPYQRESKYTHKACIQNPSLIVPVVSVDAKQHSETSTMLL